MNIDKVKCQLTVYSNIEKALEKLHTQGFYNLFYTSFQSLVLQDNSFRTLEFKQNLKLILSEMIEMVWSNPPQLPTMQFQASNSSPPPTQRISSTTPTRLLQKAVSSCANLKELSHISGGPTFSKEKRGTQKEIPITPGPGSYSIEHLPGRSKSPSIKFPKEKRLLDIIHKESPGPSAYSPNTHFQSKF